MLTIPCRGAYATGAASPSRPWTRPSRRGWPTAGASRRSRRAPRRRTSRSRGARPPTVRSSPRRPATRAPTTCRHLRHPAHAGPSAMVVYPDIPDNFRTPARSAVADLHRRADRCARAGGNRAERGAIGKDLEAARADLRLEITRAFWAVVTGRDAEGRAAADRSRSRPRTSGTSARRLDVGARFRRTTCRPPKRRPPRQRLLVARGLDAARDCRSRSAPADRQRRGHAPRPSAANRPPAPSSAPHGHART